MTLEKYVIAKGSGFRVQGINEERETMVLAIPEPRILNPRHSGSYNNICGTRNQSP
jgi:hypothetical protein